MKFKLPALILLTGALLFTSCGKNETINEDSNQGGNVKKKQRIAVIPKAESHIFWKTAGKGAEKAAEDLGVEVIYKGPDKADDRNSQVQAVQSFAVKGVDAMCIAPIDGDVLTKPIESAAAEGIKMVVWDSGLKRLDKVESFVATDNKQGGVLCGEEMARLLDGNGKVIMLRMQEGSISTAKREAGFLEGLKAKAPDIELLSIDEYGGSSVGSAQKKAQLLLNKYADEVTGIFCCNETTTEGMLLALKQQGLAGKVKFVGFDSNEALLNGMNAGEVHALAVQSPYKMGYLAVKAAKDALDGKTVERVIDTGVTLVTQENKDTEIIQEILNPELVK
ncbi:MAG: substrate-binding domain-containing protein [Lentisphaeria bacterium]|nr:substrate-binding domain-containing protein [Lentisphaeria bacterium]